MQCNICGSTEWKEFARRPDAACAKCGSLERTRILFKHLQRLGLPKPDSRVLHFAPEVGLSNALREVCGHGYQAVDYFEKGYASSGATHFDMCVDAPKLEDESYDLIIHNHVLEHIFCDVTSVVLHLQRALTKGGYHIFSIPVRGDWRYEEFRGELSAEDATRRFGQRDHCRNFGVQDLETTFGLVLDIDFQKLAPINYFSDQEMDEINFPKKHVARHGINPETIFVLRKEDCLFTR